MASTVFDFSSYKKYLNAFIDERPRGEKSRIAGAVQCHLAYLSLVLNGTADLSPEQADRFSAYADHSPAEADFFLTLVSHARAGSARLRNRLREKIEATLQERLRIESRTELPQPLSEEAQGVYYSAWFYSAIHLLISIPAFQKPEEIARHLHLPVEQVKHTLDFLVTVGLARHESGRYTTGTVRLHLSADSHWIPRHHASWRLQCARAVEWQNPAENVHYTSVVSMSACDVPAVQKIMTDAIEKIRTVVKASPEEAIYCYLLDFFPV
jgi:uncharacterized protein (TIGR02147 family)